jgi:hypothetical protein
MPKSRQRKNHKQKSQARTARNKVLQSKFEKEYQAKMMEQLAKLKEEYEKTQNEETNSEVTDEVGTFDDTNSLNNLNIDYTPPAPNAPF